VEGIMKPKTKYFITGIVCFSFLFISASGNQKAGWKGKIEQEEGVKVVKNPEEPLYGEIEFELELDLTIGGEEFDENYNFMRVSDVEVDEEGNIYVIDPRQYHIQKYDKDGKYLQTIGRQGEGPGEFQRASRMTLNTGGKLYVDEFRKILIFNPDHTYERSINIDFFIRSYLVTKEENFLGLARIRTEEESSNDVILIDSNGKQVDTIASFPDPSVILTKSISGGGAISMGGSPPYSPGLSFCPLSDELGVYGYSDVYRLWVVNSAGEVVNIIEKEEKRIPTSKKEESDYIKKRIDSMNERGSVQWAVGDLKKLYKFAKYKPFFSNIKSDDKGHIYLQKPKSIIKSEEDTYFDCFNKEGYYLYKVKIHEINPRIIKNGCVYTFRTDPQDHKLGSGQGLNGVLEKKSSLRHQSR
jgi:hypothetical protein